MKPVCPSCQAELGPADINAATDVAYCRACNTLLRLSQLAGGTGVPQIPQALETVASYLGVAPAVTVLDAEKVEALLDKPPSGAWYRQTFDGVVAGATTRSCAAFFLVPFTLVWAGGSMSGIYGSQLISGKFDPAISLFGLPFLLGSCFLTYLCLATVFGRVELTVKKDGQVTVFTGVLGLGRRKRFQLSDVLRISQNVRSGKNNSTTAIAVSTHDGVVEFGGELSNPRREYLLALLQKLTPNARHG